LIWSIAVAVVIAALASHANAAPAKNPLLGIWVLAPGTDCSIDKRTFTPKTSTDHIIAIGPHKAYETTEAVTYDFEAPNKMIVTGQGTGAGSEIMFMQGNDRMYPGDHEDCKYMRGK
jgi:hypothetical protein